MMSGAADTPLALTTGEPAGIGPEVAVRAAWETRARVELIGDRTQLEKTAEALGLGPAPAHVSFRHVPLAAAPVPGVLDRRNAPAVLEMLTLAHEGAASGRYRAIVTGPVQKSVLCGPGSHFSGHTEFFQQKAGVKRVVMMLVSTPRQDALKVALATTHLPVSQIAPAITPERLDDILDILLTALRREYGFAHPRLAVAGLNPHAGESGELGMEEIEVITPAILRARAKHPECSIEGPFPADTLFIPGREASYDAVLAMYHDQGLPVLKHVGFVEGVNVTLGLPYVRTSVDHGTALDIAGRGVADHRSMTAALELAQTLSKNREARMA